MGYCGPTHQVNTFLGSTDDLTFEEFDKLYLWEIVQLYRVSVSIISDRDPRLTAQFWRSFQSAMGTQIRMSIVFHP